MSDDNKTTLSALNSDSHSATLFVIIIGAVAMCHDGGTHGAIDFLHSYQLARQTISSNRLHNHPETLNYLSR